MYRLLRSRHQVRERRRASPPSRPRQTRTRRHRPEPGVVLGHHQTRRPAQMELVPPLRHLGRLLPLRRRLARRTTANPTASPKNSSPTCVTAEHIPPGQLTLHADRGSSMTSKPSPNSSPTSASPAPTPAPRLQRQPLLRSPIQDVQEHAPRSRNASPASPTPAPSPTSSSPTTTTTTDTPASATTPPPASTTATTTPSANTAKPSSTTPTPPNPTASDDHPSHPKSPTPPGSTNPNQTCLTPLDTFRAFQECHTPFYNCQYQLRLVSSALLRPVVPWLRRWT